MLNHYLPLCFDDTVTAIIHATPVTEAPNNAEGISTFFDMLKALSDKLPTSVVILARSDTAATRSDRGLDLYRKLRNHSRVAR